MDDLFARNNNKQDWKKIPLALRIAPRNFSEFVNQEHIVGEGKLLRRAIETDRLSSVIFYGPSGCGKSALARIIKDYTKSYFVEINAVTSGVEELRKVVQEAVQRRKFSGQKTIVLIDEIHHFNRSQQDALLPAVEKGEIILIGITTENPYFYLNFPLISRSLVFEFKMLDFKDLKKIAIAALKDKERGLGEYKIKISSSTLQHLIKYCEGDARRLLNALEIGVLTTLPDKEGVINFTLKVASDSIQKKPLIYDKKGDAHYDTISAFIKSMRGSDPDATLYWLAKMLYAGEDPRFIARRISICAAEDVGNADPFALVVAQSALRICEFVGMPEAKIPLAQAAVYVACAPKSNAVYQGLIKAEDAIKKEKVEEVPVHLKDAHLDGNGKFGHGVGYKYPHNFKGHYVKQKYRESRQVFYQPSDEGVEKEIKERLKKWRNNQKLSQ